EFVIEDIADPVIERRLTGVVRDEKQEPLPGVSVMVKGTNRGTITDMDGHYALDLPDDAAMLTFSFVGFVPQEVAIGSQSVVDVIMSVDTKTLEEIVVIGYNRVKKSDITGSVTSVGAEEIKKRPVAN